MRAKADFFISFFSALCLFHLRRARFACSGAPPRSRAVRPFRTHRTICRSRSAKRFWWIVSGRRPGLRLDWGGSPEDKPDHSDRDHGERQGRRRASLIIWDDRGGRQFFNVTVRASSAALDSNIEAVRRELSMELPGQTLKVLHGKRNCLSARYDQGHDQFLAGGANRGDCRQSREPVKCG